MLIPKNEVTQQGMCDIVLRLQQGHNALEHIHEGHPTYLPLYYVFLFPYGKLGWHEGLIHLAYGNEPQKRLSQRDFYAFQSFPWRNEFSTILHGRRLFQQFLVDAWASIEQNTLWFLWHNQDTISADLYQGIRDAIENDLDGNLNLNNLGKRIILPATFIGSAQNMFELFQDSMAITRYYHHANIFGTMTANPKWQEVVENLLLGQTPVDQLDLIACVF
jgi:hypothetical protein